MGFPFYVVEMVIKIYHFYMLRMGKNEVAGMNIEIQPLIDARHTGKRMKELVLEYYTDMAPYASMSLNEIYRKIADIPFSPDPQQAEVLKRPKYTMEGIGPGGDCDDKAIALCSWAQINSIPWRLIAVGRRKPGQKWHQKTLLTHVFPQLYIYGNWVTSDPTYPSNVLGTNLGGYHRVEIL